MERRSVRLPAPDPAGGYDEVLEYEDGRRAYMLEGQFHRVDGPAFVSADRQAWHLHGREHRVDGPAVEFSDGEHEFWIDGVQLSADEFASHIGRGDHDPAGER